jgi:hypothetical protein
MIKRLRFRPFLEGERSVDNVDALTSARLRNMGPFSGGQSIPPDYVKTSDEGRPRK